MMRLREAAWAQLIFSFRKILKPMIRILLRAGIPYLEFREVLKGGVCRGRCARWNSGA